MSKTLHRKKYNFISKNNLQFSIETNNAAKLTII